MKRTAEHTNSKSKFRRNTDGFEPGHIHRPLLHFYFSALLRLTSSEMASEMKNNILRDNKKDTNLLNECVMLIIIKQYSTNNWTILYYINSCNKYYKDTFSVPKCGLTNKCVL